ncbi:MAG: ribosomal protein S18-alanine N-acetyltransferase [Clostridiaceae bacterium]|jgi:ribosomal-protein-alanine N-acetyltransferase|nr:ribosomal protein S18-alanine N-acetyltransferase [Clostridiaceae bacterium]
MTDNSIVIRKMQPCDIEGILKVEERSFATPWSFKMFMDEVNNPCAVYYVALSEDEIVAYAGVWFIMDEGHITNIAVDPDFRHRKIATGLLNKIFEESRERNIRGLTLEVRESNISAVLLYKKFGFTVEGKRKGYYSDTNEDALIMWCHLDN